MKNDSAAASFYHKEKEENPLATLWEIGMSGNSSIKYRMLAGKKYRITQYASNIYQEQHLSKLDARAINRMNAEQHIRYKNTLNDNYYKELDKKLGLVKPTKVIHDDLAIRDVKFIREYLKSPEKFNQRYGSQIDFAELKKVYDKNLGELLKDESKKLSFLKIRTTDEKTAFLKKSLTERNYNNIIYSAEHSRLNIKRTFPDNYVVKHIDFFEKKNTKRALNAASIIYDFYNYDGLDINNHPVKNIVEDYIIGEAVTGVIASVVGIAGLPMSPALLLLTMATEVIVSEELKEYANNALDYLLLDNVKMVNYYNDIMNNEKSKMVYTAIYSFFSNYSEMIDRFEKEYISQKKDKKRYEMICPKPMNSDRLTAIKYTPEYKILNFSRLHELKNIQIAAKVIEEYLKYFEYQAMSKNSYDFKKDEVFTRSETTKVTAKVPKVPVKKTVTSKDLIIEDLIIFYSAQSSWDYKNYYSLSAEFPESYLYQLIEPFL